MVCSLEHRIEGSILLCQVKGSRYINVFGKILQVFGSISISLVSQKINYLLIRYFVLELFIFQIEMPKLNQKCRTFDIHKLGKVI